MAEEVIACPHCGQPVTIPMTVKTMASKGGQKSKGGGRPRLYETEEEREKAQRRHDRRYQSRKRFRQRIKRLAEMRYTKEDTTDDKGSS